MSDSVVDVPSIRLYAFLSLGSTQGGYVADGGYVNCMEWCPAVNDSIFLTCHTQTDN